MAYIDRDYMDLAWGPSVVSGALTYGGTPTELTGSTLDAYVSRSCDFVDGFVFAGGYRYTNGATDLFKMAAATKAIVFLFKRSGKPIPEDLAQQEGETHSFLVSVQRGEISPPGLTVDTENAAAGGHNIGNNEPTGTAKASYARPFFDKGSMFGSWD